MNMGQPPQQLTEDAPGLSKSSGLKSHNVLVVEDEKIARQIACNLLLRFGVIPFGAEDGHQALSALDQKPFDLILMDIQMPLMDGLQATEAIRKDGRFDDLPIIAMTATADASNCQRCLKAGMNNYLFKPILPDDLYAVIAQWLPLNFDKTHFSSESKSMDNDLTLSKILPDFNVSESLERLLGNSELYKELLIDFRTNYTQTVPTIAKLLTAHNYTDAKQLLHAFKSVCGNLGAHHIAAIIAKIENAIKKEQTEEIHALINDLEDSIVSGFAAIDILPTQSSFNNSTPNDGIMNKNELAQTINELADMLEQQRFDAAEFFAQLRARVPPELQQGELNTLNKAIKRLDYAEAVIILSSIAKTLNIELKS